MHPRHAVLRDNSQNQPPRDSPSDTYVPKWSTQPTGQGITGTDSAEMATTMKAFRGKCLLREGTANQRQSNSSATFANHRGSRPNKPMGPYSKVSQPSQLRRGI